MEAEQLAEVEIQYDRILYMTKEEAEKEPSRQRARSTGLPNGDILSLSQAQAIACRFPTVQSVMIGRGLVADPGMLRGETDLAALEGFLQELLEVYEVEFGGSRNAMFRMKENWGFLHSRFEGCDKLWKQLRKTTDAAEFKRISSEILHTCPFSSVT